MSTLTNTHTPLTAVGKMKKHESLNDSISSIDSITSDLINILLEIKGDKETEKVPDDVRLIAQVSLAEMLETAPQSINEKVIRIRGLISEIGGLIF